MRQRARCHSDSFYTMPRGAGAALTSMTLMSALVKSMFSSRGSGTPLPSTPAGRGSPVSTACPCHPLPTTPASTRLHAPGPSAVCWGLQHPLVGGSRGLGGAFCDVCSPPHKALPPE